MREKKPVAVRLPEEEYDQLRKLADSTERSLPAYIRQVLRWYLRSLQDETEPSRFFNSLIRK